MKYFLIALVATFTLPAFACKQNEAQIIGSVLAVKKEGASCVVRVKLSFVEEHFSCPIEDLAPGYSVGFKRAGECPKAGEEISGVLLSDGQALSFQE